VLQPASAMSLEEVLSVMKSQYEGELRTVAARLSRAWYSASLHSKGRFYCYESNYCKAQHLPRRRKLYCLQKETWSKIVDLSRMGNSGMTATFVQGTKVGRIKSLNC